MGSSFNWERFGVAFERVTLRDFNKRIFFLAEVSVAGKNPVLD